MLEFRKNKEGTFSFVVKSPQGHQLLESVPFANAAEARRQATALLPVLKNPGVVERTTDHQGAFRFALKGPDGSTLGHSQAYRSEAGMENGIVNTLKGLASGASES